jgi:hypothetical protein
VTVNAVKMQLLVTESVQKPKWHIDFSYVRISFKAREDTRAIIGLPLANFRDFNK